MKNTCKEPAANIHSRFFFFLNRFVVAFKKYIFLLSLTELLHKHETFNFLGKFTAWNKS